MPSITISDESLAILQRHATPLVDTYDSVIAKLNAAATGAGPSASTAPESSERRIDVRDLPRLTHTKVLDATIGGTALNRPNWNSILDEIVHRAVRELRDLQKVRKVCPVNMIKGRKNDEGYTYLADIDVSLQGQDANSACRSIVTAAQALGIAVDIGFMWRHKEDAALPGKRARLQLAASKRAGA